MSDDLFCTLACLEKEEEAQEKEGKEARGGI
jgi:hypothetical protein